MSTIILYFTVFFFLKLYRITFSCLITIVNLKFVSCLFKLSFCFFSLSINKFVSSSLSSSVYYASAYIVFVPPKLYLIAPSLSSLTYIPVVFIFLRFYFFCLGQKIYKVWIYQFYVQGVPSDTHFVTFNCF